MFSYLNLNFLIMIWLRIFFYYCFFRVQYMEIDNGKSYGYFLVKRVWVWILASPFVLLYIFGGEVLKYIVALTEFEQHWVECEKRPLTFKERLAMTYRLSQ